MKNNNLNDLLVLKLKALLDVEKQLVKALPKMAKKAGDAELAAGFEKHLEQTKGHVERLEKAFKILGLPARATTVEAIRGLTEDAEWVMKNVESPEALDAALIAAAQYVEHYEIAGYGTACEWAKLLGQDEVADLMDQTLQEEKAADEKLTTLATSKINDRALSVLEEEESR